MTQEVLKQMYQLLLTEPHAPTVCAQLERIAREALSDHAMQEVQRLGQEIEQEPNYKKALEVWLDKTEWVQETVKPHELGMHRADVLKQRIEEALAQPEQEQVMMEIFWGGEEAGVKLTQGFIDSHKVLQLDVLIDAKAEIERIYEELLGAKE